MSTTYTAEQVYDSLIRQGYDEERARVMALAVSRQGRVDRDELRKGLRSLDIKGAQLPSGDDGKLDSNFAPNLAEGLGYTAGGLAADRYVPSKNRAAYDPRGLPRGLGRGALGMLPGALAGMGTAALTGTNYYDRASTPQLLADLGGSLAGAYAGDSLGSKLGRRAQATLNKSAADRMAAEATKKLGGKVTGKAAGGLLGRVGGAALGRTLGGVLGAAGGPAGSVALSTLLGYALPKLMPGGSKSVLEEDDDQDKYRSPF